MMRRDWEDLIPDLNNYFGKLALEDPKKFQQRVDSYLAIIEAIRGDSHRQLMDACTNTMGQVKSSRGRGKQEYFNMLTELKQAGAGDMAGLHEAWENEENVRIGRFFQDLMLATTPLLEYAKDIREEKKVAPETSFWGKKEKEIKDEKSDVVETLRKLILKSQEEPDDLKKAKRVMEAYLGAIEANKAIKEEYGVKEGRVGDILNQAIPVFKKYLPAEFHKIEAEALERMNANKNMLKK